MKYGKRISSVFLSVLMLAAMFSLLDAELLFKKADAASFDCQHYIYEVDFYMDDGDLTENTEGENSATFYLVSQNGTQSSVPLVFNNKHGGDTWTFTSYGAPGVPFRIELRFMAAKNKTVDWGIRQIRVRKSHTSEGLDPVPATTVTLWTGTFGMRVKGTWFASKTASCTLSLPSDYTASGEYENFYNQTNQAVSSVRPVVTSFAPSLVGMGSYDLPSGNGTVELPLENRAYDQYGCTWMDSGDHLTRMYFVPITISSSCPDAFSVQNRNISVTLADGTEFLTRRSFLQIDLAQVSVAQPQFTVNLQQSLYGKTKQTSLLLNVPPHKVRFINNITGGMIAPEQTVAVGSRPNIPNAVSAQWLPITENGHYVFTGSYYNYANQQIVNVDQQIVSNMPSVITYAAKYVLQDHTFEETGRTPSTCTAAGSVSSRCTVCGFEKNEALPIAEHRPRVLPAVAPTCTAAGLTEGSVCAVCGQPIIEQEEVGKLPHAWGEWSVVTAPSYTAAGLKRRTCTACPAYETEELPQLVHDNTVYGSSGASVAFDDGVYNGAVTLDVRQGDSAFDNDAFRLEYRRLWVNRHMDYDITTYVNGAIAQPNGVVLVSLPIPNGFNRNYIKLYHVVNGVKTAVPFVVRGDCIFFETDHFSMWTIEDDSQPPEAPADPETPAGHDTPAEPTEPSGSAGSGGSFLAKIMAFFAKIAEFFRKLFSR